MIGYREENGKIERTEDYLKRLARYMKLYAALVQVLLLSYYALNEFEGPSFLYAETEFYFL